MRFVNLYIIDFNAYCAHASSLKSLLDDEFIKLIIMTNDGEKVYIKAVTEDAYIPIFGEIDKEIGERIVVGSNENTVQNVFSFR